MLDLTNPGTRENALLELSKKRESFPELAPYLWHSFGTISSLLQEIVTIYPLLSPPSLTAHASNRVCNALALLQCVASHPETRSLFLQGEYSQYSPSIVPADGLPSQHHNSDLALGFGGIRAHPLMGCLVVMLMTVGCLCCSARAAVPVPLPQYDEQDAAL